MTDAIEAFTSAFDGDESKAIGYLNNTGYKAQDSVILDDGTKIEAKIGDKFVDKYGNLQTIDDVSELKSFLESRLE